MARSKRSRESAAERSAHARKAARARWAKQGRFARTVSARKGWKTRKANERRAAREEDARIDNARGHKVRINSRPRGFGKHSFIVLPEDANPREKYRIMALVEAIKWPGEDREVIVTFWILLSVDKPATVAEWTYARVKALFDKRFGPDVKHAIDYPMMLLDVLGVYCVRGTGERGH